MTPAPFLFCVDFRAVCLSFDTFGLSTTINLWLMCLKMKKNYFVYKIFVSNENRIGLKAIDYLKFQEFKFVYKIMQFSYTQIGIS